MLTIIFVCIEQEGGRQDVQPSRLTKHFTARQAAMETASGDFMAMFTQRNTPIRTASTKATMCSICCFSSYAHSVQNIASFN